MIERETKMIKDLGKVVVNNSKLALEHADVDDAISHIASNIEKSISNASSHGATGYVIDWSELRMNISSGVMSNLQSLFFDYSSNNDCYCEFCEFIFKAILHKLSASDSTFISQEKYCTLTDLKHAYIVCHIEGTGLYADEYSLVFDWSDATLNKLNNHA